MCEECNGRGYLYDYTSKCFAPCDVCGRDYLGCEYLGLIAGGVIVDALDGPHAPALQALLDVIHSEGGLLGLHNSEAGTALAIAFVDRIEKRERK